MMYAYDKNIVPVVQDLMGGMFDFAVYALGYRLREFYELFLASKYCKRVERADSSTVMGQSGIELCYDITGCERISGDKMDVYETHAVSGRSREYWTGWALAYYQWITVLPYIEIDEVRDIDNIARMYDICHEMDINQFVDRMNTVYKEKNPNSRLKQMRLKAGLSQKNLSDMTMIPLKTIQQYEQRQKNINKARVDYVVKLSKTLNCDVEMLLEIEME